MTLFLPLLLVGPVIMLLAALQSLAARGPLGWVAAAALLAGVVLGTRSSLRAAARWWASTKAPERPPVPTRGRPVPLPSRQRHPIAPVPPPPGGR